MINKTCENCIHEEYLHVYSAINGNEFLCCERLNGKEDLSKCHDFKPKEELVRKEEREKMIEKINKFYHTARNEKFSNSMNFLELLVYLKED